MVANMSSTPNPKVASRAPSPANPKRAPLLPSEPDNNGHSSLLPRRPKAKDVSSRYLSSTVSSSSVSTTMTSTSSSSSFSSTTTTSSSNSLYTPRRRFPSPLNSSTNLMTPTPSLTVNNKRAQSEVRRRPAPPRRGEVSVAAKMLSSTPARSLSTSFQGQSFAAPLSKAVKPPPNSNGSRNSSPERRFVTPVRKLGTPTTVDQQRWPASSRQGNPITRSVDFTNENLKLSGSVTGTATATAVRALKKSMMSETNLKPNKPEILEVNRSVDNDNLVSDCYNSDRSVSDAESVSSGSTIRGAAPRGIVVPARYKPEHVSRPLSRNGPAQSPRGLSRSPVRGGVRPASPSKSGLFPPALSSSRGMASPTRTRGAIGCNSNLGNAPSVFNFADESRRRKVGDNAIADAHALRLLHNKYLQWRYANAKADAAMAVQRETAQKSLYNAWVATTKKRESVISKQIEIQQLRQSLKLHTVLHNQIPYLNVWDQVERDHTASLSGTIVSLESSTLRLPLVDGAKADLQSLKDAIVSAADVMQSMASFIRSLLMKVEHVNALVSELASTSTKEISMIDECKDLLSILTQMEVHECSLRTHILQLQRSSSTRITEM